MLKNFFTHINNTFFINPKLNKDFTIMLQEEKISEAISFFKNSKFIINYESFMEWLNILEKVMNGHFKSQFIGDFNKLVIYNVKENLENNDILKKFYISHPLSHKGLSFNNFNNTNANLNNVFLKVYNYNSEHYKLINLIQTTSEQNSRYTKQFTNWLLVETLFGDMIDKKPETILTLKEYFNANLEHQLSNKAPLVLIEALNKIINKKSNIKTHDIGFKEYFSNIEIPLIVHDKVQTIKKLIQPLINSKIFCEEDRFTINQIINNYIERDVNTYHSMPEQYRDNMKNSDGFTMTELLHSNLDKYILLIKDITTRQEENKAAISLKQQTINNKFVNTKSSYNS